VLDARSRRLQRQVNEVRVTGWRWLALPGSHVLHLVQAWKPVTANERRWEAACRGKGIEVIAEPAGHERCLSCLRLVLNPKGNP
jgi:hypothetical protein